MLDVVAKFYPKAGVYEILDEYTLELVDGWFNTKDEVEMYCAMHNYNFTGYLA